MFAALTPDRKYLSLAVVNATESQQKFELNLTGYRLAGKAVVSQLTGSGLEAANRVGQEPQVEVRESEIENAPQNLTVAPASVSIYRLPIMGSPR